ncbi:MAG: alkaline phosphatase family protein, partial [Gemmatimonadales bacterium]
VWSLQAPASALPRADADTSSAEGDGVHSFFPHRFSEEARPEVFWYWWEATPKLDEATLQFAKTMVSSLELGRDDAPDFLSVSLSATDRIGHGFSPLSREQLDNLLQLDRELGEFFDYLDTQVGRGRWTTMLTADHGVLDSPEDLVARGEYGHRITPEEIARLNGIRADAIANPDKTAARKKIVSDLKKLSIIGDAWTRESLEKSQPTDSFAVLQKRSLYPGRFESWYSRDGVEFRFKPGILNIPRGSSHGQTYWYDRHVPMIFMGPGVPAGKDPSRAETVDMAPTFSAMLGISYPKDLDGKVLNAVVRR